MIPKAVKQLSGNIMLYLLDLEMISPDRQLIFRCPDLGQPQTQRNPISGAVEYLAWIENIIRIERFLDLPHQFDGAAELLLEECHLALADPVFASARAIHCQCASV